jgi:hypothetical protein
MSTLRLIILWAWRAKWELAGIAAAITFLLWEAGLI